MRRGARKRTLPRSCDDKSCIADLARQLRQVGVEADDLAVANSIALLWQAADATAAWVGNAMVALARRPALRSLVVQDRQLLDALLGEVLRFDPPVQNTRRFVAERGGVAGIEMSAGDVVLVLLAAANRDPRLNPDPDRFDLERATRRGLGFGHGPHGCPGDAWAATIARAGLRALLDESNDWERFADVRYRPSANVRIPRFGEERLGVPTTD